MPYEFWLRQQNSNPAVWCPYQMPNTVITGLAMIAEKPPGIDAGWFYEAPGGVEIVLYKSVQDEIRERILDAADKDR